MARSRYFELMAEEERIRRAAVGAFSSVEELGGMLKRRAEFANKIQLALNAGDITQQEYDALTQLNRQHALPRGSAALPFFGPSAAPAAPRHASSSSVREPGTPSSRLSLATNTGLLGWLAAWFRVFVLRRG